MDQGSINLTVRTPRGTLIEETMNLTDEVIERIRHIEWIEDITVTVGSARSAAGVLGVLMDKHGHTTRVWRHNHLRSVGLIIKRRY
jgi:multidrug efflux pump subunit AcrB